MTIEIVDRQKSSVSRFILSLSSPLTKNALMSFCYSISFISTYVICFSWKLQFFNSVLPNRERIWTLHNGLLCTKYTHSHSFVGDILVGSKRSAWQNNPWLAEKCFRFFDSCFQWHKWHFVSFKTGTSTMLTFITLSRNTGSSLPKVSYIKATEIWFIGCTIFIFGSLVEFAFVNTIWRRRYYKILFEELNSKKFVLYKYLIHFFYI